MNIVTVAIDKTAVLDASALTTHIQNPSGILREILAVTAYNFVHLINICEVYAGFSTAYSDLHAVVAVQAVTGAHTNSLIAVYQSFADEFDETVARYRDDRISLHDAHCLATARELAEQQGKESIVLVTANPVFQQRAAQENVCTVLLVPPAE